MPLFEISWEKREIKLQNVVIGAAMREIWQIVDAAAASDAPVMIRGETGVGKEVAARQVHQRSGRAGGTFVPINCGAVPSELLESELFGHRKGAFTGAISDHKGRFEIADGGTLFLDEIGDMPAHLQVKILRVLEDKAITPVGAVQETQVDVRIIAATHQDLEKMILSGSFREDLYYRLNVIPVNVPPLRERREEFDDFLEFFAEKHAGENDRITFSSLSRERLRDYHWPGNVRELSNLIARFNALWPESEIDISTIPRSMLPPGMRSSLSVEVDTSANIASNDSQSEVEAIIGLAQGWQSDNGEADGEIEMRQILQDVESKLISAALEDSDGNVSAAAKRLNMQRTTLIQRIAKLGLRD